MSNVSIENADAFKRLRELAENSYQAAMVDFPWQFETENGTDRFGHDHETGDSDLYETITDDLLATEVLPEVGRVVKPGGWVFIFADDDVYPAFREMVEENATLERRRTIYWDSVAMGMGYYFRVQGYPMIPATVGKTERYVKDRGNVIQAKHAGNHADYPTEKPVDLYKQLLAPVLERGESLLEPFGGTCPGAAVAREMDLEYLAFEQNANALSIARERASQRKLPTGGE